MTQFIRTAALVGGGVLAGFVLAHLVNSTPKGQALFGQVNERMDDVRNAIQQGYRARTEAIYAALEAERR